jgi:hypothetical protein
VWSSAEPGEWVFDVATVYKGTVAERQSVWSPLEGASCGLELPDDRATVVVFAGADGRSLLTEDPPVEDPMFAHLCGGTRTLDKAAIPASFGEPRPPMPEPNPEAPETAGPVELDKGRDPWVLWGAVALGLVIIGVTTALVRRRNLR